MRALPDGVRLAVGKLERAGLSLPQALRAAMLDPALPPHHRAAAAGLLERGGDPSVPQALLALFFAQSGQHELYDTALTLEFANCRAAVPALTRALLEDPNPHRRHAAARALGWITPPTRATALALAQCLTDPAQPHAAREVAAESLAYAGNTEIMDALISVLQHPDARLRFWAVFALGSCCRRHPRAVQALEPLLLDGEAPPGNWWPVGREALAVLAAMPAAPDHYRASLASELRRILADPDAPAELRRWADFYGSHPKTAASTPPAPLAAAPPQ